MSARVVQSAEQAAPSLAGGGLVVFPTETFYGLAVRADSPPAIERLLAVKGREPGKPLPLIAADREEAARLFELPGPLALLAAKLWPGPLTLAAHPRHALHPALLAADGTAGVRVSPHPIARALAEAGGGLITATSANRAGGAPPDHVGALDPGLAADIIIDAGRTAGGAPSTVVALAPGGSIVIVRAGAVAASAIEEALRAL